MKVRFHMHIQDYSGTIVNVKRITITNGHGTVETMTGERWDAPERYIIEDACSVTMNELTHKIEIIGAD